MEVSFVCPWCGHIETVAYYKGIFDVILYDEPRFPGSTVYQCGKCGGITSLGGEGLTVRVTVDGIDLPVKLKADEYEMTFRVRSRVGETCVYNVAKLEEVIRRFVNSGSLPC